jgi:hypothetical protein
MGTLRYLLVLAATIAVAAPVRAQGSDPHAKQLLESVVQSELTAADNDHSNWTYRNHNTTAEKNAVYRVVETPAGSVRRMIEINGHPVDSDTVQKESERITDYIHDSSAQAKVRRASAHDDAQARQLLQMLPSAFIWTVKSETADLITLSFRPNPEFHPPNMEGRVMGTMAGELVIAKGDNRIRTLRGSLSDDIRIGYGILGRLRRGGTFDIERREIAPHIWQITETRVHIEGRAIFFKTIGQQEDEIKSDWKPSTAKTLDDAAKLLGAG